MGSPAIPVKRQIEITGPVEGRHAEIVTAAAMEFVHSRKHWWEHVSHALTHLRS